jgi:hypothetical protein
VDAGSDQAICAGSIVTLAGTVGGGASSGTWSGGAGTFSDRGDLNATYTPTPAEITARTVTLTLTTNDPDGPAGPCIPESASMTISISRPVLITSQPYNVGECVSYPASLLVVATGDDPSYQWYRGTAPGGTPVSNSGNISGATSTLLSFNQAELTDAGTYYVVVSGGEGCDSVTSNEVTLNVDEVITVDQQPQSQTLCAGGNVTFTVDARPFGQLLFQWRKDLVDIPGATSPDYTITNVQPGDAGGYDVVISGLSGYYCSEVISTPALLTVNEETITLTSGVGSDDQTICVNTSLPNITYQLGGVATDATTTGLPSTLSGSYNPSTGIYTISGTPTADETIDYVITTTGPCEHVSATGSITVLPNSTISLTSGNPDQTVCIDNPISNIVYTIGGSATFANADGLPAGVQDNFNNGVLTISGSPTVSGGPFNFIVTTNGPCLERSLNGTITVTPDATISLVSGPDNQTVCEESPISDISYQLGGSATNPTVTDLPAGVTGIYDSGTGLFTISGFPTASGSFNYTVIAVVRLCVMERLHNLSHGQALIQKFSWAGSIRQITGKAGVI